MDETLRRLGELLLGAIPTVVLLTLLYAIYSIVVHRPLRRVLEQRRARTEGAMEKARADISAAEARTAEYEQRLREARAAVFRAQEARRQAAIEVRTEVVEEARRQAHNRLQAAKKEIERDADAAKAGLEADVRMLAREIAQRVLVVAGTRA